MHPNKFPLEIFKDKFYTKFPDSSIEILNYLEDRRVLVKDEFGLCNTFNSMLLRYGTTSIRVAIDKTNYYINKAKKVHGDRFDYSKVNYIGFNYKIIIICPIHGEFLQSPEKHLTYNGCSKCSYTMSNSIRIKNTEYFIKEARKIHGNLYNYELSNYTKAKQKLIVICKLHGNFEQTPNNHLQGQGCSICGQIRTANTIRKNLECFMEQANVLHNNKFNYTLVNYINTDTKVKIICPIHGIFEQAPKDHLRNKDCRKCSNVKIASYQKTLNNGWSHTIWENKGKESKTFDSFKVYIIKCWNEEEEFYKIGKTFNKLNKRFSCKAVLPYNYEIIKIIEGDAKEISLLERRLHKIHKKYLYTPKIYFEGNSECFSNLDLGEINKL